MQRGKLTSIHQTVNVVLAKSFEYITFYLGKIVGYQQSQQGIIVSNNTSW